MNPNMSALVTAPLPSSSLMEKLLTKTLGFLLIMSLEEKQENVWISTKCALLGKRMEHVHWIEVFPLAMKMVMGQSQAQTCSDSCKPLVLSLATGVDPKGVWMSILVARPGQGLACVFLTHS